MDAIKKEGDPEKAEGHFRRALALDPAHEDARYYLAAALVARGETPEALEHLRELARRSPRSHRAFKRWGTLEALAATSPAELEEASRALERALELNQEETGSLLVLGEVALMQGEPALAAQRLEWACRTNPKAVGGFFLRGYVAWKRGDPKAATALLDQTRQALGPEWKPAGTVAEGDTTRTMHEDETPLARFWRAWDGEPDPATAYAGLDGFLTRFRS
jgi:tetratricopeptide (TPR) repeat protein